MGLLTQGLGLSGTNVSSLGVAVAGGVSSDDDDDTDETRRILSPNWFTSMLCGLSSSLSFRADGHERRFEFRC